MNQYLNTFFSNLKQPFRFRLWKYSAYLVLVLTLIFVLFGQSELVQDWENRFQPNLYAFKKSFFTPETPNLPIVLVTINDQSLPNELSRAPLNRLWLAKLLEQFKKHQPAVIGFNILLDRSGSPQSDLLLAKSINNQSVILRNNNRYPVLKRFANVSKSSGAVKFKFDSSGSLHYICNSNQSCRSKKLFHIEILNAYLQKQDQPPLQTGLAWSKINYITSQNQTTLPFPSIQADEIEKLPAGALKNKIVLIGTDFPDLYPLYRVPSENREMQEIEVLAHALNAIASKKMVSSVSLWMLFVFGLILFVTVSLLIFGNSNWLNIVQTVFVVICLYFCTAFIFANFNIELPFVFPVLLLILLLISHTGLLYFYEKVYRLETEVLLKQSKIDFLTNELHSHSLFNELSRLSVMIRQNPGQARDYLVEFAEMLRSSLKFGDQLMVPIYDHVEYLKSYIKQQQIIFGERLDIQLFVDEKILDHVAPWHVFYPLTENAIKYTEALIKKEQHPCTIQLRLELVDNQLRFSTSNPFLAGLEVASTKTGLINLKNRLNHIYSPQRYKLDTQSENGIWMSTLTIPDSTPEV